MDECKPLHIGRVGDLVKDALEDKFAKTAKAGLQGAGWNLLSFMASYNVESAACHVIRHNLYHR